MSFPWCKALYKCFLKRSHLVYSASGHQNVAAPDGPLKQAGRRPGWVPTIHSLVRRGPSDFYVATTAALEITFFGAISIWRCSFTILPPVHKPWGRSGSVCWSLNGHLTREKHLRIAKVKFCYFSLHLWFWDLGSFFPSWWVFQGCAQLMRSSVLTPILPLTADSCAHLKAENLICWHAHLETCLL